MFGHKKDSPSSAPPPQVVKPGTSRQRPDDEPASLQDSPRKRQRTEQVVSPSQTFSTPGQPPKSAQPASKPIVPTRNTDGSLSTQARPISPPSLKRLATSRPPVAQRSSLNQNPNNTPAKSRSASAANTPSVTSSSTKKVTGSAGTSSSKGGATHAANASSTSTSAEASPSAKPRKPETLNPRLLKKSPATYQTRVQLLKMLHQEYTRLNKELKKVAKGDDSQLVLSDQHLIWKALDEEEKCATEKPTIYSNVVKNRIMQYKRMAVREWTEERRNEHQSRNPKSRSDAKSAGTPKVISTGLKPAQEVQILRRLVTSIKGLDAHGYVPTPPAEAEITKARQGLEAAQGWEKCDRCDKRFQVFPGRRDEDGALTSGGVCEHHYGKTYFPERQPGDRSKQQKRYRCCGTQVGDSVGCTETPHHVFKVTDPKRLAAVMDFAETPENPSVPSDRAVCFDCEMCYTVNGLELVRLTATAWPSGDIMLDILVQPLGEILDLNSRFSGVWPEDMSRAQPWTSMEIPPVAISTNTKDSDRHQKAALRIVPSPNAARDLLFSLLAPNTPLIGHGLENDLNSVRIIHPTLVDTVLLNPHKHGLPYRHGLKMLMETLLNRKIQMETGGKIQGHDSAEDARAAGELALLKVMEEWQNMRFKGWTLEKTTGDMVPPKDASSSGTNGGIDDTKLTVEFLEAAH
ncbi:hypothetical protein BN1708_007797 [Verticillium longisporum]|uniref:Exonuclease domain-containing protein n=3 Tax=Verticillium longisporum TaxID=100787 RepID=A0A0G4MWF4_VERLO|nr:hypothetical protein BN1708_007797 [Verticillium longisporum]